LVVKLTAEAPDTDRIRENGWLIMASVKRRYSKEEFARRGDAAYEGIVRPKLKPDDEGRYAAIDIDSGSFEIAEDELEACDKLRARVPKAQIWLVMVGSPYRVRFGGRQQRRTP
jgi:hypothetical protein